MGDGDGISEKNYPRIWVERLSKTKENFSWDNPYTRQDFKYKLKHWLLHHLKLTNREDSRRKLNVTQMVMVKN